MFEKITQPFVFIRTFFPVQILFGHLKYNLISLFYWSFLFLIIAESFGRSFGIPLLFFSPEYLGKVSVWSFALLGFAIGGFTMAFNTYSYIKLGPRYPFLATVSRPFFKFCINNTLLPIIFILYYLKKMAIFQLEQEFAAGTQVATYIMGFSGGFISFMILSIFYFFPTTREKGERIPPEETSNNPIKSVVKSKIKWYNYFRTEKEQYYYYIGKNLRIFQSRSTKHLDRNIIENIFAQNRINASIFEIITITAFIISGQFIDYSLFEFPAAMSIVLMLTILHMIFSALMSWFHRWTYPILFISIYLLNYLSQNTAFFNYTNFAYGLSYEKSKIKKYNISEIRQNSINQENFEASRRNMDQILTNWKQKTKEHKPKIVILTTSGGGSRSALWTFSVLQYCDASLNNKLSKHINMITGASGGMIGAAYYRELLLRSNKVSTGNLQNEEYLNNLGKDLLNKLSFSLSTKDLFYRFQKFSYNGHIYPVDRGYAFEEQLNENTNGLLDHPLGHYELLEKRADIPLMILTPTIVNDGRRLYLSAQSLSFMTEPQPLNGEVKTSFECIDYQTFFKENNPQDLRFISALRTSATFPFIMPMVTMPTSPEILLMDAGIRDNYGIKTALNYLYANRAWIEQHTSGVILLSIRDTKKVLKNESYHHISLTNKFTLPFGNMYNNFPRTQDFDQEQYLNIALNSFQVPIKLVTFNLRENQKDKISLSWHLTRQEKNKIKNALNSLQNKQSLQKLRALLVN